MKWCSALCVLVLLTARSAVALPGFWTDRLGSGASACTAHPDAVYGDHRAPVQDTTILFSLAASGTKVTSVCPGKSYELTVSYTPTGYLLVTTTVGTLSGSTDSCKNRAVFADYLASYTTTLAIPATTTATSLELAATFVGGQRDNFHQMTATIPISSTCATTTTATPPATGTKSPAAGTKSTYGDDDDKGKKHDDDGDATGTSSSSSPAATTPPTSSGTPASSASSTVAAFTASMCKQPTLAAGASCTNSTLGYACSHAIGALTTHWTIGGCAPSNPCTKSYSVRNSALNAAQTYLHYAATYKTTGYVSVGFAKNPGSMAGTDAVLGWVNPADGSPVVDAFHVTSGNSLSVRDKYTGDTQWLALSGASVTADGYTTICFSRPLSAPTSNILKTVPTDTPVGMNWAVGRANQRSLSRHTYASGYTFNPVTGATAVKDGSDKDAVLHGLLMALAWVALAPLGVLFARHRWVWGDFKLGKVHFWFHAHRLIQFLAVALFCGGLALAWTKLGEPNGGIGKAHTLLAWLLLVMAGLQFLAAFIRPAGDAPKRRYWNLFHWNLGRLTLATGVINTFIGVVVYDRKYGKSVTVWFAVLGAALAAWVVAEVVLSLLSLKKSSAEAAAGPGKDVEEVEVANLGQQQQGQAQTLYPRHSTHVV